MKMILAAVFLLALLVGLVGQRITVYAQVTDQVAIYRDQIDRAFKDGRFVEALPAAEKWAAMATASASRGRDYASAMGALANVYRHMGRYAEAEPLYLQQLRIANHYDLLSMARAQSALATLYLTQGRFNEAEPLYRGALYSTQKALGDNSPTTFFVERTDPPKDPPEVGVALINLADLYRAQGRHAEAHPLYLRAIAIYEGALLGDRSWVAPGLEGLGVILSACNTASEGEETTEPLSGIAQAFFHAGARSLLVSHWYVDDFAATELTTRVFVHLESSRRPGRAEALRQSMRDLIHNEKCAFCAHPSMWAPFVLVGAEAE